MQSVCPCTFMYAYIPFQSIKYDQITPLNPIWGPQRKSSLGCLGDPPPKDPVRTPKVPLQPALQIAASRVAGAPNPNWHASMWREKTYAKANKYSSDPQFHNHWLQVP